MPVKMIKQFLKLDAAGGIILFFAAVLAIILDNTPLSSVYNAVLQLPFSVHIGAFSLAKPLLMWINDGFMVLFFLMIGLELKREIFRGHLSKPSNIFLPLMAALGGMLLPALIYFACNYGDPHAVRGWAIPVATDIAFAFGILSLLGDRVPKPLKLFMLAATIFDDIGAIILIALFHTGSLSYFALIGALLAIFALVLLNRWRVQKLSPYALVGFILWVCVLKSGVHATLAGIILAFAIPVDAAKSGNASPVHNMESILLPWVSYLIVPLFGFANAGISFVNSSSDAFFNHISLGIIAGLFFGKQIGIFVFTWVFVKLGLGRLPKQSSWLSIYGVSLLCGIGFTMSLFIGTLAFGGHTSPELVSVRFGVLIASILCGISGYFILNLSLRKRSHAG